jgi:hypothetical protein
MFEKSQAGASRLSVRRNAAISMSVSELCTRYLIILAQAPITTKPSEAALDNPSQARDLELALSAFNDLQLPAGLF